MNDAITADVGAVHLITPPSCKFSDAVILPYRPESFSLPAKAERSLITVEIAGEGTIESMTHFVPRSQ